MSSEEQTVRLGELLAASKEADDTVTKSVSEQNACFAAAGEAFLSLSQEILTFLPCITGIVVDPSVGVETTTRAIAPRTAPLNGDGTIRRLNDAIGTTSVSHLFYKTGARSRAYDIKFLFSELAERDLSAASVRKFAALRDVVSLKVDAFVRNGTMPGPLRSLLTANDVSLHELQLLCQAYHSLTVAIPKSLFFCVDDLGGGMLYSLPNFAPLFMEIRPDGTLRSQRLTFGSIQGGNGIATRSLRDGSLAQRPVSNEQGDLF